MRCVARARTSPSLMLLRIASAGAVPRSPEAFARVVVDAAELRTGPGVSYRVVYTAHRGETLALDGRPGAGFWLRVLLPDGRVAYALGDEVQPFAVAPASPKRRRARASSRRRRSRGRAAGSRSSAGRSTRRSRGGRRRRTDTSRRGRRSSSTARWRSKRSSATGSPATARRSFTAGAPRCTWRRTGWFARSSGSAPGGSASIPNSDSFVLKRQDLYAARAGGGLLIALRWRILVRLEVTNLTLFTADSFNNAQTYAGGLGVYF